MLTRLAVAAGHDDVAAAAYAAARDRETENTAAHCRGLIESDPAALMAVADAFPPALLPLQRAHVLENAALVYAERRRTPGRAGSLHRGGAVVRRRWARPGISAAPRPGCGRTVSAGAPAASARPDFGWDALTATELKIAYLVADGQSNPDIAAELFLSRNTVQTHVSHILTKLDARSRTEIATQALARPRADR